MQRLVSYHNNEELRAIPNIHKYLDKLLVSKLQVEEAIAVLEAHKASKKGVTIQD